MAEFFHRSIASDSPLSCTAANSYDATICDPAVLSPAAQVEFLLSLCLDEAITSSFLYTVFTPLSSL